ncbi:MAG: phosphoribosylamine--glycine ligase [Solirubrobacterales bacterium]|nr:phosphoribosylamine--glycine ligase [Solirubrobacterales bacterium]
MRMAEDSELHAFLGHANPTILLHAERSGGDHRLGDICDPAAVAAYAREREIDLAMVSSDEPLAAGVVDALRAQGTTTVGPTSDGAEIEWNKVFARELLAEVAPESVPQLRVARSPEEVAAAIASFGPTPVVVKPAGLTGGKGVKVMGPHLADHAAAHAYALELLEKGRPGEGILLEERVDGAEFTIQAISDGETVVFPNATYDYPYRFDGDEGPGTGGMGSLSLPGTTLPFMTPAHYEQACSIIQAVIERLGTLGRHFSGVMNSGFFATADGVKVIEFNARFGDPECMNIMSLFEGSWTEVMRSIAAGTLSQADVPLRREASVVLYLVSPDYALRAGEAYDFTLDRDAIESDGGHVFFSSAVALGASGYRTVGTSRAVALASTAPTLEQARARVTGWAERVPVLEWRRDVGDGAYLDGLTKLVAAGARAA